MANQANPRKFSEKIALHNQKQAEETAAFNAIMNEVKNSKVCRCCPKCIFRKNLRKFQGAPRLFIYLQYV